MTYYGYQPEQVKAQIRSTRGETIDMALPPTCTVGELCDFLIDQYSYHPHTCLLYNGQVADSRSYVTGYPYGALSIATPADRSQQPPPQPLQQQHTQPKSPQQQHKRSSASERVAARAPPAKAPSSDGSRKSKAAESAPSPATSTARRKSATAESVPESANTKPNGTVVKYPPKKPHKAAHSTSSESCRAIEKPSESGKADVVEASAAEQYPSAAPPLQGSMPSSARISSTHGQRSSPPQTPPEVSQAPSSGPISQANPPSTRSSDQTSPAAEASNGDTDECETNHRARLRLTVDFHIPSLNKVVCLPMTGDSSVVDLMVAVVAAVPELEGATAQVIYRGKALPQTPQSKLFDLGIRADARVFIAAGEYNNTDIITLLEVEEDTAAIEEAMKSSLTDLQRKGYYEELMRILFRTDGLQNLEGEWRTRRKDAVKRITALQDRLDVEHNTA